MSGLLGAEVGIELPEPSVQSDREGDAVLQAGMKLEQLLGDAAADQAPSEELLKSLQAWFKMASKRPLAVRNSMLEPGRKLGASGERLLSMLRATMQKSSPMVFTEVRPALAVLGHVMAGVPREARAVVSGFPGLAEAVLRHGQAEMTPSAVVMWLSALQRMGPNFATAPLLESLFEKMERDLEQWTVAKLGIASNALASLAHPLPASLSEKVLQMFIKNAEKLGTQDVLGIYSFATSGDLDIPQPLQHRLDCVLADTQRLSITQAIFLFMKLAPSRLPMPPKHILARLAGVLQASDYLPSLYCLNQLFTVLHRAGACDLIGPQLLEAINASFDSLLPARQPDALPSDRSHHAGPGRMDLFQFVSVLQLVASNEILLPLLGKMLNVIRKRQPRFSKTQFLEILDALSAGPNRCQLSDVKALLRGTGASPMRMETEQLCAVLCCLSKFPFPAPGDYLNLLFSELLKREEEVLPCAFGTLVAIASFSHHQPPAAVVKYLASHIPGSPPLADGHTLVRYGTALPTLAALHPEAALVGPQLVDPLVAALSGVAMEQINHAHVARLIQTFSVLQQRELYSAPRELIQMLEDQFCAKLAPLGPVIEASWCLRLTLSELQKLHHQPSEAHLQAIDALLAVPANLTDWESRDISIVLLSLLKFNHRPSPQAMATLTKTMHNLRDQMDALSLSSYLSFCLRHQHKLNPSQLEAIAHRIAIIANTFTPAQLGEVVVSLQWMGYKPSPRK